MTRLIELSAQVPPDQHAALKAMAAARRVSLGVVVREILAAYLGEQGRQAKGSAA